MKTAILPVFLFSVIFVAGLSTDRADAEVPLGSGNFSLLGGDLTDPEDDIVGKESCAGDLSKEELKPARCNWVEMKSAPNNPPGTPAHQRHCYQSWQNAPACAIFLNKPQQSKWYVGFKDGGYGGPTRKAPYYAAVRFAKPIRLTHFTFTTSPDMPGRDPREWAIQGSNTGKDDDWTDIFKCDAKDRGTSPLREGPRNLTMLFVSFTSESMAKVVGPNDLKKLRTKLGLRRLKKADFSPPEKGYTWYRIVAYSCFNPNSMEVPNPARPSGFAIGQLELFGVPGVKVSSKAPKAPEEPVKPPVFDPPFIISYWCGPPKSETNLARYREIADCGMNVAFVPINGTDEPTNRKLLDLCKTVGIKALVAIKVPRSVKSPDFERTLDAEIVKYSSHPALLGYHLWDEPNSKSFALLGAINQYLLKKDPKHLPYINLLPNYASREQLGNNTYDRHVAQYIDTVKPALVSWDHYRQMLGDESYYWPNLEIVRFLCLKAKTPLIQIINTLPHFGYRNPSEADLRWQVYTSLAYGSRGIIYFTYWDVKELAAHQGPAIMTMDGKRDVKWQYVKKINHRIAKLGPTLVKVTSTGVYCTDPLPNGTRRLTPDAPVKKAEGGAMVIGCFQDAKGRKYIMPVNRSFHNKITAKLTMDEKTVSVSEVSQQTGELVEAKTLSGGVLEVPLEAGEGRMFLLDQKP